jgi:hypothetical protein
MKTAGLQSPGTNKTNNIIGIMSAPIKVAEFAAQKQPFMCRSFLPWRNKP